MLRPAADNGPADWVVAALRGFGESVLSVVPAGFEGYLRVFHPAYRAGASGPVPVSWSEIARANGTRMHPGAQFGAVTGGERYEWEGQPGVFDQPPRHGTAQPEILHRLAATLGRHTATPSHYYFAFWEGFGGLPEVIQSAPRFSAPNRTYHLLSGSLDDLYEAAEAAPLSFRDQSPNLWWPEDRAWCVATELDLLATFVGGHPTCLQELASLPDVEAAIVPPDLGVDWLSDALNPSGRG